MDITLQKAVELGVKAVQPLFSERSVMRLTGGARRARCALAPGHGFGVRAMRRNVIPELAGPLSFTDWLATLAHR